MEQMIRGARRCWLLPAVATMPTMPPVLSRCSCSRSCTETSLAPRRVATRAPLQLWIRVASRLCRRCSRPFCCCRPGCRACRCPRSCASKSLVSSVERLGTLSNAGTGRSVDRIDARGGLRPPMLLLQHARERSNAMRSTRLVGRNLSQLLLLHRTCTGRTAPNLTKTGNYYWKRNTWRAPTSSKGPTPRSDSSLESASSSSRCTRETLQRCLSMQSTRFAACS
jgi:hypothetical protein